MQSDKQVNLVIVDSVERFQFFLRIYKSLKNELNFYFVTAEPLVFIICKLQGIKTKLIYGENNFSCKEWESSQAIEVLNHEFTQDQANQTFGVLIEELNKIHLDVGIEKIICWNGQQVLGLAANYFAIKEGISTRFLELANLPLKCFSDSLGVNGNSSLAYDPGVLDSYSSVDESYHQAWVQEYIKRKSGALPQSKMSNKGMKLVNYTLKFFYKSLNKHKFSRFHSVSCLRPSEDYAVDCTVEFHDFIFFPMQVSNDTQIKINSDVNNIEAIKVAGRFAKEQKKLLVVKVHPAEVLKEEVDRILSLKKKQGFLISNENTIDLIRKSSTVVTINSTVGLEAMIFNKPVIVLGRALYASFDQERLKKYIHRYLIPDVDYFSKKEISSAAALKLLGGKDR